MKKYDERVQFRGMRTYSADRTEYYFMIYNYDCKIAVTAMFCMGFDEYSASFRDGFNPMRDERDWDSPMYNARVELYYDHVTMTNNNKSVLDMWNGPDPVRFTFSDCPDNRYIVLPVNSSDYNINPLVLKQFITKSVSRVFSNTWFSKFMIYQNKIHNYMREEHPIIFSRYLTACDVLKRGNINGLIYHTYNPYIDMYEIITSRPRELEYYHPYQLYLQEMEQEDINTSIRHLF